MDKVPFIGKSVMWAYLKYLSRHYKDSSEVCQKLGLVENDTNLSNFLQKLLKKDDGVKENMIDQRVFPRILALAEQMWYNQTLSPLDVFHERILQRKAWFESKGYVFGPSSREEVEDNYRWE